MASAAPAVVRRSVHFSDSLSQSTKDKKLFKAKRENETLKSEKAKLARELKTARRQHNSAAPPSEDVANLSEQVAVLREQVDELRTLFLSSGVSNSTPSRTASAAAAPAMSVAEQEFADFRAHKKLEKERATEMKRLKAMTACMKPLIQDVMKDCMTHTRCASSHHTAAHRGHRCISSHHTAAHRGHRCISSHHTAALPRPPLH
jgi:myosin heavy subunit